MRLRWWIIFALIAVLLWQAGRLPGLWTATLSWTSAEIGVAAVIAAFCFAWWLARPLPRRLERIDWRVVAILIPTFLSVAGTMVGLAAGLQDDKWHFVKDVFAGWIGGVAFFGFVGAVVAIASLARPADDPFDARVRILVRGRYGPHIDDFISRLRTSLAHYAERVTRTLTVDRFDPATGMLRVVMRIETTMRSYVDDVETTYESLVAYTPDHPPPPGEVHRLAGLYGVNVEGPVPFEVSAKEQLLRRFTGIIPREGSRVIDYELQVWVKANDEPLNCRPVRFTRAVAMELRNNLNRDLTVRLAWRTEPMARFTLRSGGRSAMFTGTEVAQGDLVHQIFIDL